MNSQDNHINKFKQRGFTLLEMVLVLFLIGLMASATLMLTEGVEDQAKYDETKRRMELIRKAIVGDPTRTINGSPEISGFVADMGRLPGCIRELLEALDCSDPAVALSVWSMDITTGVASGWRGPYISVLPERNAALRFRDGYGNSDAADTLNSGWSYTVTGTDITLSSEGFETGNGDDISASQLVVSSDWQVQLPATVNVSFKNQSASNLPTNDIKILLRIYLSDLSNTVEGDDGSNPYLFFSSANPALAGNNKTLNFTLDSTPNIPIGKRAYALLCYEVPATGDVDDYKIFDGDCDLGNADQNTSTIRTFSVVPRQTLTLNLEWVIS